jgi:hypothetical protein
MPSATSKYHLLIEDGACQVNPTNAECGRIPGQSNCVVDINRCAGCAATANTAISASEKDMA